MKINDYGQVEISAEEAFQSLYTAKIKNLDGVYISNEQDRNQFNLARETNADRFGDLVSLVLPEATIEEFDQDNQQQWFMPEEYKQLDIAQHVLNLCKTDAELQRVGQELLLFQERELFDLLRFMKYLVDTLRKHNIVWGVGRGSSVASYVLYLIGVHRIDSIKYGLEWREFLKP